MSRFMKVGSEQSFVSVMTCTRVMATMTRIIIQQCRDRVLRKCTAESASSERGMEERGL